MGRRSSYEDRVWPPHSEYGYQHASDHLRALGVQPQLAQRLLALRYDRREAQAARYAEA